MKNPNIAKFRTGTGGQLFATAKSWARSAARQTLPTPVHNQIRKQLHTLRFWPPVGWVRFGNLRRVEPVSRVFGLDRGKAIDRYYIEHFLARHAMDIRGCVLEVADNAYTQRFGGERVTESRVLYVQQGNPKANIVGDLSSSDFTSPSNFDCIVLTQTLQYIYDTRAAVQTLYRILKPGGVLLATLPGIAQISRYDMDRWGDCWRFTSYSAQRLFADFFPSVAVNTYGNVLAAIAFLQGLAAEDLRLAELDRCDPDYEILITVRAVKPYVEL